MNGKFTIEIDMGNASMSSRRDLSRCLKDLSERLKADGVRPFKVAPGKRAVGGVIRDDNGNRVGHWLYVEEK